ncbi:hypothetical protein VP01_2170g6 [Puccinia sorghi]|uniref:Uncharacterized protein n=1 Tax=Puccinia sorghi TaxID=27349 RepID=A0A0L6VBA8_9BASI|nr:hypothetical protein VP01_2170g6 [Puccinia sorghi]
MSSDLLLYKQRIVVLDDPNIKLPILQSKHDSPLAETSSWPGMTKDVKDYELY